MAKVNSVMVLAPNGRRQTVKVTPNSTVLQVLEEVCNKHDFDPQEYDIRHHTRILDTTMTMQFSRIPNNAQLEIVKAKKVRRETEVLVNVQTESGNRLSGSFFPSDSLWDVLTKLCPDIDIAGKYPAVIYMRQEVCGIINLKSKTLRCLGLTNGRALLRLMYKSIEGDAPQPSNVQSEVNNVTLTTSTNKKDGYMDVDPPKIDNSSKPSEAIVLTKPSVANALHSPITEKQPLIVTSENLPASHEKSDERTAIQHSREEDVSVSKKLLKENDLSLSSESSHYQQIKFTSLESSDFESNQSPSNESSSVEDIFSAPIEPRNRNPIVFKRGVPRISTGEDLPDEFFELTLDDVRYLYRDLRNKRTEINDAPLQTSDIKKLEESKRVLNNLHKYRRTVLRIQFPDQTVLQGSFSPVETIQNVHEFVQGYLEEPSLSFYLYTTPPKVILTPSDRLIEANCVPCAVLHFGLDMNDPERVHYLRSEVMCDLSSLEAASAAAIESRGLLSTSTLKQSTPSVSKTLKQSTSSVSKTLKQSTPSVSKTQESVPSTSGTQTLRGCVENSSLPSSSREETKQTGNPNGKVPKWFKLTPK